MTATAKIMKNLVRVEAASAVGTLGLLIMSEQWDLAWMLAVNMPVVAIANYIGNDHAEKKGKGKGKDKVNPSPWTRNLGKTVAAGMFSTLTTGIATIAKSDINPLAAGLFAPVADGLISAVGNTGWNFFSECFCAEEPPQPLLRQQSGSKTATV